MMRGGRGGDGECSIDGRVGGCAMLFDNGQVFAFLTFLFPAQFARYGQFENVNTKPHNIILRTYNKPTNKNLH